MDFFAQLGPSFIFCLGAAIATVILMRRMGRVKRTLAQSDERLNAARETDKQAKSAGAPAEMVRWQVDLYEEVRDAKAELDSKMCALQHFTALAEEARQRLEHAIARARQLGLRPQLDCTLDSMPEPRCDIHRISSDHQREIYQLADDDKSAVEIARAVGLSLGDVEFLLALRK